MKKFILNNKLPIFLLMCVLGLSIFYAFTPNNNINNVVSVSEINESNNYYYFDEERLSILEERNNKIDEIEASVAASNLGISEISSKLEEIENIYSITNKECSLELEIESLGYDDVLVHNYISKEKIGDSEISTNVIDIKILTSSLPNERAVAISQLAKTKFGNNSYKVSLILETNNIA